MVVNHDLNEYNGKSPNDMGKENHEKKYMDQHMKMITGE